MGECYGEFKIAYGFCQGLQICIKGMLCLFESTSFVLVYHLITPTSRGGEGRSNSICYRTWLKEIHRKANLISIYT
jgi:hypothetical protein